MALDEPASARGFRSPVRTVLKEKLHQGPQLGRKGELASLGTALTDCRCDTGLVDSTPVTPGTSAGLSRSATKSEELQPNTRDQERFPQGRVGKGANILVRECTFVVVDVSFFSFAEWQGPKLLHGIETRDAVAVGIVVAQTPQLDCASPRRDDGGSGPLIVSALASDRAEPCTNPLR